MTDSFSPTFKRIVPRPAWPCEIKVSHMGKKTISYKQRWEKRCYSGIKGNKKIKIRQQSRAICSGPKLYVDIFYDSVMSL